MILKKKSPGTTSKIPWSFLKNPVYGRFRWSVKDACMTYLDGNYFLFFSAFYFDRGKIRSHVVEIQTQDWITFSKPLFIIDGRENGWTGLCSPDISLIEGRFYLSYNSWGNSHPNGKTNSLFCQESSDLVDWTPRREIAHNLTADIRTIDISITKRGRNFIIIWKDEIQNSNNKDYRTRMAYSPSLYGNFHYIGNGYPEFWLIDGTQSPDIHENFQFLNIEGIPHLLSTDYPNHHPVLYQVQDKPQEEHLEDWLTWIKGISLNILAETFNTNHIANAAAIADWRSLEGYFYLVYGGNKNSTRYKGRGKNRLGIARSPDLKNWQIP